jgi:hypothetical protein
MQTTVNSMSTCDKVLAILHATNDGSQLAPKHLSLTNYAVMDGLTPEGVLLFENLYKKVCVDNSYDNTKVYFWDIEHLTNDHEGFVYWKGHQVEHYSFRDGDAEYKAAQELAKDCLELESRGMEVNKSNLFDLWDVRYNEKRGIEIISEEQFHELKGAVPAIFLHRVSELYQTGGFAVGEPQSHDEVGPVYSVCWKNSQGQYCKSLAHLYYMDNGKVTYITSHYNMPAEPIRAELLKDPLTK